MIWQASSDPSTKEAKHRVVAKELLWCREQLLLLITSCYGMSTPTDQLQMRPRIADARTDSPFTNSRLTRLLRLTPRADKMLKSGHFTFSDEEIDTMLPTELRKNKT